MVAEPVVVAAPVPPVEAPPLPVVESSFEPPDPPDPELVVVWGELPQEAVRRTAKGAMWRKASLDIAAQDGMEAPRRVVNHRLLGSGDLLERGTGPAWSTAGRPSLRAVRCFFEGDHEQHHRQGTRGHRRYP